MDKQSLRKSAKEIRLAMSQPDVKVKSREIIGRFIKSLELNNFKSIHIYRSVEKLNEVQTALLNDYLHLNHPGLKVVEAPISPNSEPPKEKFDLIIVPVLAFDSNCNRLGWGGGWYDRFLAGQPQALKVGLAYQSGLVSGGIPVEAHDIKLAKIITEQGIIEA